MIFCSIFNPNPTFSSVTVSGLTPTHVVYAGTGGLLSGSANLVFDGTNLTCAGSCNSNYFTANGSLSDYNFGVADSLGTLGRFYLQNQSSSQQSHLIIFTKDGDNTDAVIIQLMNAGSPTSIANSVRLIASIEPTVAKLYTLTNGTYAGTLIPLYIYTASNTSQLVLNTDGSISMSGALSASSFSGTIYASGAVSDGTYTVGNRITPDTGDLGTITVSGGIITGIQEAT